MSGFDASELMGLVGTRYKSVDLDMVLTLIGAVKERDEWFWVLLPRLDAGFHLYSQAQGLEAAGLERISEAEYESHQEKTARLTTALADAIRRPMGVIPESALGLVGDADLLAAERRRANTPTKRWEAEAFRKNGMRKTW